MMTSRSSVVLCDVTVTLLTLMMLLMTLGSVSSYNNDRCDTIVWDFGGATLGVHDVNGSCTEGHVEWRSPYGAIRVSLQLRSSQLHKHAVSVAFESCFVVSAEHTSVKIFLDDLKSDLIPLAVLNSSHSQTQKELCFVSEGSPVVVYIESELDSESATFGVLRMDYDNRRLPVTMETDGMEDCRPCTDLEITEAVCSSDFVVTGSMSDVVHHHDLDQSALHFKVEKVYRQRLNMFKDSKNHISSRTRRYPRLNFHTESGVREYDPQTEAPTSLSNSDPSQSEAVIFAPKRCGIRKGHGEFLFIGRIRLKKALLQCAPRLEDFIRIWKMALQMETNMCYLT